jgi:hypothetical protein
MKVIVSATEPTAIGYQDVFEEGDEWVKINSCEGCPLENIRTCCNNCPMLTGDGKCYLHLMKKGNLKPYECAVRPMPDAHVSPCQLEFRCIKGSNKGKIRRIRDKRYEMVEESR